VGISRAKDLLAGARNERDRTRRHLLVAAALHEVFTSDPIVVGGVAEDYWAADVYVETDLDICVPLTREDELSLKKLGFSKDGRHWFHKASSVAVEFPDSYIDGDEGRTVTVAVGGGSARIIGVEDLYLDRVRGATVNEWTDEDVSFRGAVAVASAHYLQMDWKYIVQRLAAILKAEPLVGRSMKRINSLARRRARSATAR